MGMNTTPYESLEGGSTRTLPEALGLTVMSIQPCRMVFHPDPILRAKAQPVEHFDDDLRTLTEEMIRLRKAHSGVGLAAPQVGHSVRMFICNTEEEGEEESIFINPEILEASGPLECDE